MTAKVKTFDTVGEFIEELLKDMPKRDELTLEELMGLKIRFQSEHALDMMVEGTYYMPHEGMICVDIGGGDEDAD